MKKALYVVYDRLAETIVGEPLSFPHDAPAVRFFSDLVADASTTVHKHALDHELRRIGQLDYVTAELTGEGPFTVITGTQLRAAQDAATEAQASHREAQHR